MNGKVFALPLNPPYLASLRGHARGVEVFLQRSGANRFTGWISYAYGREVVTAQRFPSDWDQRHTVNVYGGYRVTPSVNTNRTNYIFDALNGFNSKTGHASVTLDKLFPVLPSAGLMFER